MRAIPPEPDVGQDANYSTEKRKTRGKKKEKELIAGKRGKKKNSNCFYITLKKATCSKQNNSTLVRCLCFVSVLFLVLVSFLIFFFLYVCYRRCFTFVAVTYCASER